MIEFTIYGRPQPQGSSRAFIPKGWKRPIITSANKNLKSWRQEVSIAARAAMDGKDMIRRPVGVRLSVAFIFQRPKSLPKKVTENSKAPDCDKLCRSVGDSLSGICYEDDAQITHLTAEKVYGSPERTDVRVYGQCEVATASEIAGTG